MLIISTNSDILQEIHVEHADYFIAAGQDTEDNIMSCLLAKAEGAGMVIAIRDNDRYGDLFGTLGVDHVINPKTDEKLTGIDVVVELVE